MAAKTSPRTENPNFLYEIKSDNVSQVLGKGRLGTSNSFEDKNRTKLSKNKVIDSSCVRVCVCNSRTVYVPLSARQASRISEDSSVSIIRNTPTFSCFGLFFAFSENGNVGLNSTSGKQITVAMSLLLLSGGDPEIIVSFFARDSFRLYSFYPLLRKMNVENV